jgi:adenosylcobyric acid synthase
MVWGCTSDAGKSLLATALCRWFSNQGLRVAPYKAQNMSNNARVAQGGEMGCAQHFQALAARRVPDVRMNPVLLKPERDTASQVVVMGEVDRALCSMDWRSRSALLWERARPPLSELLRENDIVVMEGAGSPAEINLAECDYVNLLAAREARAVSLLVSDIDRGGSFAHLFGTWSLLPDDLRGTVRGFVLNKFRGDASLLSPGPEQILGRTGVPVLGVIPRVEHGLPDEDAVSLDQFPAPTGPVRHEVRVVAWPRISNFDEFRRLAQWPGVRLLPARSASDLHGADLVILPGSKNTPSDLAWLRERGMDAAIVAWARSGKPLLGVCGGLQALGLWISDEVGTEGSCAGLGLLPVATSHGERKKVARTKASLPRLDGFWRGLSGREVQGYEIRTGASRDGSGDGLFFHDGEVLGTYLHGLFEDAGVLASLFGGDPRAVDPLEETFEMLAKLVDENLDMGPILGAMDVPAVSTATEHGGHEGGSPLRHPGLRAGVHAVHSAVWMDSPVKPGNDDENSAGSENFLTPKPQHSVSTTGLCSPRLCVLTGGVRSGKSRMAERIAAEWGGRDVAYLATAQGLDDEMLERIAKHRSDRADRGWETIEEPLDAAGALERTARSVVLLDCATLLVTNLLLSGGPEAVRSGISALLAAWRRSGRDLVVVTNEVGLGIVPDNALAREYRDLLGWTNQRLVEASTEAWLMVSGRKLSLS